MKRSELFFSVVQVPVDYLMIVLAAISVFHLRRADEILAVIPKLYQLSFNQYIKVVLIVAPLFLVVYAFYGLYKIQSTRRFLQEASRVFAATSFGIVGIIIAVFLQRDWFSSRVIIRAGWAVAFVYVVIGRWLLQKIQKRYLVEKGVGVHRVLLVGANGRVRRFAKLFAKHPELGYKVVDIAEAASVRRIGEIRQEKGIDEIIVCDPTIPDDEQAKILDYCEIHNITFKYFPTMFQTGAVPSSTGTSASATTGRNSSCTSSATCCGATA